MTGFADLTSTSQVVSWMCILAMSAITIDLNH